jgi:hypothetical protein
VLVSSVELIFVRTIGNEFPKETPENVNPAAGGVENTIFEPETE